jgi:hypothetical protein
VTYRPTPIARFLFPLIFVVFVVVAVAVVVATARGNGPPIVFLAFWLFAFGWNAYWWSLRVALEVGVDGLTLRWRTALLGRQASVGDVVRVRPSRWNRQLAVIELQGRRPLIVPVRYGFGELTRAIGAAAPHASIEQA